MANSPPALGEAAAGSQGNDVISRLKDGLGWRWRVAQRYLYLASHFQNGLLLAARYRRHLPNVKAVCWDGTVFRHPSHRTGLAETIIEVWHDRVYTGEFYHPAPTDVVIDAGANVGLFAVWVARSNPRCRVIAFEPFAENFALLLENSGSAGVANLEAHHAALGGTAGRGQVKSVGNRSLDHRVVPSGEGMTGSVPIYSFADALRLAGTARVALFKIDIEGSEYDLFEHAEAADLARVDRFAIEYHDLIRPGTLELLRSRLAPTHEVVGESGEPGQYGMLYARRRGEGVG